MNSHPFSKKTLLAVCASIVAILSGCATSQSANVYTTSNVMSRMAVKYASITSLKPVKLENPGSGVGGSAGASTGAIAGSGLGQGRGSLVGMVAGAVVGGVAGAIADKAANSRDGLEIGYKLESTSEEFLVVQALEGSEDLKLGDRVRVIEGQYSTRVSK
jgi:outer membrane lipoprotein SlyB